VSESSHDLVAAHGDRVRDILRIVGAGQDITDLPKETDESRPLDSSDDGTVVGTWRAWNS
jgi:hypothetical protein